MNLDVRHNEAKCRFEAGSDADPAHIDYLLVEKTLEIYHTEVPMKYQGKGLAGLLATACLDWAREQGFKVLTTCSYATSFVKKHPEYNDIVLA